MKKLSGVRNVFYISSHTPLLHSFFFFFLRKHTMCVSYASDSYKSYTTFIAVFNRISLSAQ